MCHILNELSSSLPNESENNEPLKTRMTGMKRIKAVTSQSSTPKAASYSLHAHIISPDH